MKSKQYGITMSAYGGTFYVLDEKQIGEDHFVYLEHDEYKINNERLRVIAKLEDDCYLLFLDNVKKGWDELISRNDELDYALTPCMIYLITHKNGSVLPYSAIGGYPLLYMNANNDIHCNACATKMPHEITNAAPYFEGAPIECDGCGDHIESAYGEVEGAING